MTHTVKWKLRDTQTGEVREGEETSVYYDGCDVPPSEYAEFSWIEGNRSCNCTRALYFARAKGEPDPNLPCGDGRFVLVSLTFDGEQIAGEP